MKSLKSSAARVALAAVAASSALVMTACSAGQISQTNQKVPAVNGQQAKEKNVALHDANIIIGPDDKAGLKFTASNVEQNGEDITLQSVKVDGKEAQLSGDTTIKPGCNLVADHQAIIQELSKGAQGTRCANHVGTTLEGVKDLYIGGSKEVTFTFSNGDIKVQTPVNAWTPKSGETYRGPDGHVISKEEFHKEEGAH